MKHPLKRLTLMGLLIAMSVIGANIHFAGSIALDSFPAFLGSLLLGPGLGFVLGIASHLVSALLSGFPMTLPVHLLIGLGMGLTMLGFGYAGRAWTSFSFLKSIMVTLVGLALNLLSGLFVIPFLGWGAILPLLPLLTLAALVNILLALGVYFAMPTKYRKGVA